VIEFVPEGIPAIPQGFQAEIWLEAESPAHCAEMLNDQWTLISAVEETPLRTGEEEK
jgi:hypothetical protein